MALVPERVVRKYDKYEVIVPQYYIQDGKACCEHYDFLPDEEEVVYVYRLDLFYNLVAKNFDLQKIRSKYNSSSVFAFTYGKAEYRDLAICTGESNSNVEHMKELVKHIPHDDCLTFADSIRHEIWTKCRLNYENGKLIQSGLNKGKLSFVDITRNKRSRDMFEGYYLGGMFGRAKYVQSNVVVNNVKSRDITSAYGAIAITKKLPFGLVRTCPVSDVQLNTDEYFSVFKIRCTGLENELIELPEPYTSQSEMWVSNIDYKWIKEYCKYDSLEIVSDLYYWGLFDSDVQEEWLKYIKGLYDKKEKLDHDDPEREVVKKKFNIASYGATISNTKYMREQLPYTIGMYIVSLQRYRWMTMINKLGYLFVYGDTDSVYYINDPSVDKIFEEEGFITKPYKKIGLWKREYNDEEVQVKFLKTKLYLVKHSKGYTVKCAGCPENKMIEWLSAQAPDGNLFDAFNMNINVPCIFYDYDEDGTVHERGYTLDDIDMDKIIREIGEE